MRFSLRPPISIVSALAIVLLWPALAFGHVPFPSEPVLIHAGDCPWTDDVNAVGCYRAPYLDPFAEIFVVDMDSEVLWHELGHSFDHANMSDNDRDRFRWVYRNFRPWPELQELFADQYAACALHQRLPQVSRREHVQACRVIWLAA